DRVRRAPFAPWRMLDARVRRPDDAPDPRGRRQPPRPAEGRR
ncbi:MAG: hypothetical protein AVDCRST_MAG59-5346, partial [uncultured Thermomicrobiales bacterium]